MSEELDVLKDVTTRLDQAGADYMLTGSVAANAYTIPRMTRDIDLVVALKREDVPALLRAFEDGYYIDGGMADEAIRRGTHFNLIHNATLIKVDIIVRKEAPYRRTEFARRRRMMIGDLAVWIVSPEDLALSKLFWIADTPSDKQMEDVANILRSQEQMDMAYIRKWAEEMGLNALLEKAMP